MKTQLQLNIEAASNVYNYPSTFKCFKYAGCKINTDTSNFIYGMTRSSRDVVTYIKGNISSLIAIVIENSNEVVTPEEAMKLLKLTENKTKRFSVNGLRFENSGFTAIAFIKF